MSLAGARLMMRLYGLPLPLVTAVPGHAIALGAFCLLTADYRVGTDGDFRIGLNETAIGMSLPPFGLMLAKERLSKRHLARAALAATMFSPQEAKDAGFLDNVVAAEDLRESALGAARSLVNLDGVAYAAVKQGFARRVHRRGARRIGRLTPGRMAWTVRRLEEREQPHLDAVPRCRRRWRIR